MDAGPIPAGPTNKDIRQLADIFIGIHGTDLCELQRAVVRWLYAPPADAGEI